MDTCLSGQSLQQNQTFLAGQNQQCLAGQSFNQTIVEKIYEKPIIVEHKEVGIVKSLYEGREVLRTDEIDITQSHTLQPIVKEIHQDIIHQHHKDVLVEHKKDVVHEHH